MDEREKRIREIITQNNKFIRDLKLQNQNLSALLPKPKKKKKTEFPPRPAVKKRIVNRA